MSGDDIVQVLKYLLSAGGPLAVLAVLIFLFPEQSQKWWGFFLRSLHNHGVSVPGLHKAYTRHVFQGEVNSFIRSNCDTIPGVTAMPVKMVYVDAATASKKAILQDNSVVIRIKKDDPRDKSFVHAVCLYVEKCLLFKAKRYISEPQGKATELLVSMKILESEPLAIRDYFLEDHLHPILDKKTKTASLFSDLKLIDNHNIFFRLYLRELNFLGESVFMDRRDQRIHDDVDRLIQFLKSFCLREIGSDDMDPYVAGTYCKFSVVIVGKKLKLDVHGATPYANHIKNKLLPNGVNTVYLLSGTTPEQVQEVAKQVESDYETLGLESYTTTLYWRTSEGKRKSRKASNRMMVLRRKNRPLVETNYSAPDPDDSTPG